MTFIICLGQGCYGCFRAESFQTIRRLSTLSMVSAKDGCSDPSLAEIIFPISFTTYIFRNLFSKTRARPEIAFPFKYYGRIADRVLKPESCRQ